MTDPVAMRRQLRVELKRLRAQAKLTQKHVASALDWSPSKVIRIENGAVAVSVTDLRALLDLYGVAEPLVIESMADMARGSKRQPFSSYKDTFSAETVRYFAYESSASIIRQLEPLVVPGLLQTEEYTKALLHAHGIDSEKGEKYLESRRERQELLERPDPPRLFFILDESAILRQVGGSTVMRRQLRRLLDASQEPNITIQIAPFVLGAYPGIRGPFVYLEFPSENDPDVLYLENSRGDSIFQDLPDVTGLYLEEFITLEDKASPVEALPHFIDEALSRLN